MIQTANRLQTVQEYYFSTKLREVRELENEGKPIINMGIGSPDLQPSKEVISSFFSSLHDSNAHKYQSYQGLPELRNAIAEFYQKKYKTVLQANSEILPLLGSKEGIMHISLAFLNKGDVVLIPDPGYPTYASVAKLVGAKPIYYNLIAENNWQPNFEELESQNLENVKIMWINYPHMPSGEVAKKNTFAKLIAFAKKHRILLVNDNPYSFILNKKPESILSKKGAGEVAIELNSLSKTFNMAGWRVGMVLGNEKFIYPILKVKSNMDSGMFYGIQKGAIKALELGENWYINQNKIYQKRRELIWKIADCLNLSYQKKSVGLFVWAKTNHQKSSLQLVDDLLYNKNIFIAPGDIFGSNGKGFVRFSLCISENKIKEALQRL